MKYITVQTLLYNAHTFSIQDHSMVFVMVVLLLVLLTFSHILIFRNRRRKEKSFIDSSKWMKQLLSSMPDTAFIYDSNLRLIEIVNPLENVLLGLQVEKLLGVKSNEIEALDPDFKEAFHTIASYLEKTAETQEVYTFNYQVTREGKTYYTQVRTVPIQNDYVICFAHDETEKVTTEKELSQVNNFFQSIVDNLPVGILVKDVNDEYRYKFFNHQLLDFFGDEVVFELGKNEYEREDPRAEIFFAEDKKVVENNTPVSFERVSYDPETGHPTRWEVTTKSCFNTPDGGKYLMAVTLETTEIQKREFELQKTQQALSLTLKAGNVSAWCYDIEKKTLNTLYGDTVAGGIEIHIEDLEKTLHPDDRKKFKKMITEFSSGENEKKKYVFRFKQDDSYQWYETYVINLKSETDGTINQIIGTERNITEEVMKQKELMDANSKLELAFAAAEIVPWEIDVKTRRFSSINQDVFEATGISIEEYRSYIDPDDLPLIDKGYEVLLNGKQKMMSVQIRVTLPGQEQRWFELHAIIAKRDKNGNIVRIVGLRRDITAIKMTDELIELRDKAERSNRMKTAFLANMSHEIRTPLNAIVGFSQLIMQTEDRGEIESYYEIIETNNELLLQLISDILDLSKIEADELDFIYSGFEVASVFNNLEQVYQSKLKEDVELVIDLPEQLCLIYTDKNRLTQVLSNLLSNACKFTYQGSIHVGYTYMENGLRFFVKDTGKGIEKENLANVFDRFSKFDSFVQGTGLGLSISQSIIEHLGGEIGVNSEIGEGTEFWFTLPCEPTML